MPATEGDCRGDCTLEASALVGSSPMNGGRRGVVACGIESSKVSPFGFPMLIGRVPDSLIRSSYIVRAGDGGIEASRREVVLIIGLAKTDDVELALDRGSCEKYPSSSIPSEVRLGFQRVDIVDMRELMPEIPLIETLSERLSSGE